LTVVWGWQEGISDDTTNSIEMGVPTDGSWVALDVHFGPYQVTVWRNDSQTPSPAPSLSYLPERTPGPLASRPTSSGQLATDGTFFVGEENDVLQ